MSKKRRINAPGPLLIGLCGARGAGKTTTAKAICDRYVGWRRMSFADPLREAGWELLRNEAVRDPLVKMYLQTTADPFGHGAKDLPIPGMEVTPRDILIELGEYERSRDPFHWINKLRDSIMACPDHVVIDDVRFEAEYYTILKSWTWGRTIYQIGDEPPDGEPYYGASIDVISRREIECMAGIVVSQALATNMMRKI